MQSVTSNAVAVANSYSTSETFTGRYWIDGKKIYRKVVDCGALPNATSKTVRHNISNFGELVFVSAYAKSTNYFLPVPYGSVADPAVIYVSTTVIILATTTNLSSWTNTKVILEYTKTTD